jgi:hypothetical protein
VMAFFISTLIQLYDQMNLYSLSCLFSFLVNTFVISLAVQECKGQNIQTIILPVVFMGVKLGL